MTDIFQRTVMYALVGKGNLGVRAMMKNASHAQKVNDRLLMRILSRNKNCEYGKKYDFASINSVEEFKKRVPIITYSDVESDVERIYYKNEQNVLTSQKIIGFATSSGSIGKPKLIPRTEKEIGIYTRYTITRALALAASNDNRNGIKHVYNRGIGVVPSIQTESPHNLPATNVADIAARKYFFLYPQILVLPLKRQFAPDDGDFGYACTRFGLECRDCYYIFSVFSKMVLSELLEYCINNWQMLVHDIETGTIDPSVWMKPSVREQLLKNMKPNPIRAAELRSEFEKGFDETIISRIWPNLSVISAIGTSASFEPYTRMVQKYTKGIVYDNSIYGASEGLFAACYRCNDPGQMMLPDSCYYEFVEADIDDDAAITETLSLSELEVGKDYEIIITNQSGFYRYRIKDVVRVLGYENDCPVINFVYRKGQLLNVVGEKTDFAQMNEAIRRFEKLVGFTINEWAVFVDSGERQHRYNIVVENENGLDLSKFSAQFDHILREVNVLYESYESMNGIDPPLIHSLRNGTFDSWREKKIKEGTSPSQVKPVRLLDTEEKIKFFLAPERMVNPIDVIPVV